jgi:tetratricopeptide (TPR) repeat protein
VCLSLLAGWLALILTGCRVSDRGGDPVEGIVSGWKQFRLGEFDRAGKTFETAAAQSVENSEPHLQALFGLATTWNLRRPGEDTQKARALYDQIIRLAPDSDLAAWSALALARMKYIVPGGEAPNYAEVARACLDVWNRFPLKLAGQEAFLFAQSARLAVPNQNEARAAKADLEQFVQKYPKSPYLSTAHSLIAQCCKILGDNEGMLAAIIRAWNTAEVNPGDPTVDLAGIYWRIATTAEFDVGDFKLAREYFRKLIEEYPTEQKVFLAKQELKRMDEIEEQIRGKSE